MVDLLRHRRRHPLGANLYLCLHLSLRPCQTAMVTGTYREVHGLDLCAQITYHDQRNDRSLRLHPSYQSRVEAADAKG